MFRNPQGHLSVTGNFLNLRQLITTMYWAGKIGATSRGPFLRSHPQLQELPNMPKYAQIESSYEFPREDEYQEKGPDSPSQERPSEQPRMSRADTFRVMDSLDPSLSQGYRFTPSVRFSADIFKGVIYMLDDQYDPSSLDSVRGWASALKDLDRKSRGQCPSDRSLHQRVGWTTKHSSLE